MAESGTPASFLRPKAAFASAAAILASLSSSAATQRNECLAQLLGKPVIPSDFTPAWCIQFPSTNLHRGKLAGFLFAAGATDQRVAAGAVSFQAIPASCLLTLRRDEGRGSSTADMTDGRPVVAAAEVGGKPSSRSSNSSVFSSHCWAPATCSHQKIHILNSCFKGDHEASIAPTQRLGQLHPDFRSKQYCIMLLATP